MESFCVQVTHWALLSTVLLLVRDSSNSIKFPKVKCEDQAKSNESKTRIQK